MEGEEGLRIHENWINKNSDGIVLYNSKGQIYENSLKGNITTGLQTLGKTEARFSHNIIEGWYQEDSNKGSIGVHIKEPSEPELIGNKINRNRLEIEIESKKQRRKLYKSIKEGQN